MPVKETYQHACKTYSHLNEIIAAENQSLNISFCNAFKILFYVSE